MLALLFSSSCTLVVMLYARVFTLLRAIFQVFLFCAHVFAHNLLAAP